MEIPVKKKSSVPWWLWLIAGLLLLGLIWWLVASLGDDSDDVRAAAGPEAPAVAAAPYAEEPAQSTAAAPTPGANTGATQGPITDLTTVFETADRRALIGREFQLSDIRVLDVVGDRTFWVGEGDRRVFAALLEVPPPGWPTDADININPRQTVSIRGTVADASSGDVNGRALQNMPPGTDIVLFAQTAEVLTRP